MRDCQEDPTVFNGYLDFEVTIAAPVSRVWKKVLDITSWVTSHEIVNVFGEPGTVGSITRVSFRKAKELGYTPAHHHYCKIVRLIP